MSLRLLALSLSATTSLVGCSDRLDEASPAGGFFLDASRVSVDAATASEAGAPTEGGSGSVDASTSASDAGFDLDACFLPRDAAIVAADAPPGPCVEDDLEGRTGLALRSGSTVGAGDFHELGCATASEAADVAFRFVASSTGTYTFDTIGSDFDTVLGALEPCGEGTGELDELACNDDASPGISASHITIALTAGQEITIVVDGFFRWQGDYVLNVSRGLPTSEEGACSNAIDDDRDGRQDCLDADCEEVAACTETACEDGLDNDADGQTDCGDLDCQSSLPSCVETCADGADNDSDGLIDCDDHDCSGEPECQERGACDDELDNDADGSLDCDDSECLCSLVCMEAPACPAVDLGSETGRAVAEGSNVGSCGYLQPNRSCLPQNDSAGEGAEATFRFVAETDGVYAFDTRGTAYDTIVYLRRGGCAGMEIACSDDIGGGVLQSQAVAWLSAGEEVVVVVDAFFVQEIGDYVLNISRLTCGS